MSSLIHFGCWNKGFCKPDEVSNGMSAVIKELLNFDIPSFYLIAGDNYYPDKIKINGKKKKVFDEENFTSGFECIKMLKMRAPVYMLMGNHDLQEEKDMTIAGTEEQADKCEIIQREMKYAEEFNFNRYATLMDKNTLCIFINSFLYTEDSKKVKDCIKIYRKEHYSDKTSIAEIREFDEIVHKKLLDILINKFTFKNIIISGHDPIVTYKVKSGEFKKKTLYKKGIEFLYQLYSKLPEANKYYLCADTHQYQKAEIEINECKITQYVVGTGGTDCDKPCPPLDIELNDVDIIEDEPAEDEQAEDDDVENKEAEDDDVENKEVEDDDVENKEAEDDDVEELTLRYKLTDCNTSFGFLYCKHILPLETGNLDFKYIEVANCDGEQVATDQPSTAQPLDIEIRNDIRKLKNILDENTSAKKAGSKKRHSKKRHSKKRHSKKRHSKKRRSKKRRSKKRRSKKTR